MSDATSHEVLEIEVEEDEPLEGVSPSVIRSGLESEDPMVRAHAARVAEAVAVGDEDAILEVVPTLIDRLEDDRRVVITKSTIVLSIVAEDHPDVLEPAVPRLVELLSHEISLIRVLASKTLGYVAVEHPEFVLGHEDALTDALVLEHRDDVIDREKLSEETHSHTNYEVINQHNLDEDARQMVTRQAAANLLVEVGELEPDRLVPEADRIAQGLDDRNPAVVSACLDVLGLIAQEERAAVAEHSDAVMECLDGPDGPSVASAIATLGYTRDPAAIEPLRDVAADEDRDEDLRDLAEETAAFVEQSNA